MLIFRASPTGVSLQSITRLYPQHLTRKDMAYSKRKPAQPDALARQIRYCNSIEYTDGQGTLADGNILNGDCLKW